jgi:hypothetical protein
MSNYWTPQLYVKYKDGSGFAPVPVAGDGDDTNGGMTVYYLQRRGDNQTEQLYAFPEGFKMLAGSPSKRSYDGTLAAQGISFNCLGANQPETNGMPNYKCPGGLRAQVFFPQCWDGKNLDSADHKSHMSYPAGTVYNGGNCPPSHPVHMISIFFEVLYDTARFDDQWDGDNHPFVFASGDATGYGLHGDFFNGWDVNVLQKAIDTCTDDSGQVEKCAAVTMFTSDECNSCKIASTVNEKISGKLPKLPGCNDPATASTCKDTVTFGSSSTNYVDVSQTKGWQYLGCGTDNVSDRAMNGSWIYTDSMTVESCIDRCSSLGFSYAAPENGNECFCNGSLNQKYAPKDGILGSCTKPCIGNADEICGGADFMSIYHKCVAGDACKNNEIGGTAPAQTSSVAARSEPSMATVYVAAVTAAAPRASY